MTGLSRTGVTRLFLAWFFLEITSGAVLHPAGWFSPAYATKEMCDAARLTPTDGLAESHYPHSCTDDPMVLDYLWVDAMERDIEFERQFGVAKAKEIDD